MTAPRPSIAPSEKPFTPEDIAERWGVSVRAVTELCKSGQLRCFRVGVAYRVTPKALAEYEGEPCESNVAQTDSGMPVLKVVRQSVSEPKTKTPPPNAPPISSEPPRVIAWPQ